MLQGFAPELLQLQQELRCWVLHRQRLLRGEQHPVSAVQSVLSLAIRPGLVLLHL